MDKAPSDASFVFEQGYIDSAGNLHWLIGEGNPTEARLAALESQVQALQLSIDNLTEYVKSMLSADQRLRCKVERGAATSGAERDSPGPGGSDGRPSFLDTPRVRLGNGPWGSR